MISLVMGVVPGQGRIGADPQKIPLLSLLAYIDLTCAHLPTFTLSTLTVHRFLIAGVCAGSKAQCDVFCTNSHYAKVGGIKVGELNSLEREFLRVTQWNLCVSIGPRMTRGEWWEAWIALRMVG